jgi:hypothetical protein
MELQIGGGGAAGTMTCSADIKTLALSICAHDIVAQTRFDK